MNIYLRIILRAAGLILAAVLHCVWNCALAQTPEVRIGVLTSHNAAPYEEALEGFKQYIASRGGRPHFDIYPLGGEAKRGIQILENVKKQGTNLLLTLGSLATSAALNNASEIPTIAGLVLDENEIKKGNNATGVVLGFPVETQLQWIRRVLPDSRAVGIVHSPKTLEKVESAEKVAQTMGLKLYARQVETPSDIPGALEYLAKHVDVLWGLADEVVFTSQTAERILLVSFQSRIPLVGISSAWVKAGALYSLDWDYADIGSQCAEMALLVLEGAKAGSLRAVWPRKVLYSLNLKTARHMKIDFQESLIQGAHQVFR